mgnify:CR=1 FL=1
MFSETREVSSGFALGTSAVSANFIGKDGACASTVPAAVGDICTFHCRVFWRRQRARFRNPVMDLVFFDSVKPGLARSQFTES